MLVSEWIGASGGLSYNSEFEAREAARFVGRPYAHVDGAFVDLPLVERASIIAHYRTHNNIESAVAKKAEKK